MAELVVAALEDVRNGLLVVGIALVPEYVVAAAEDLEGHIEHPLLFLRQEGFSVVFEESENGVADVVAPHHARPGVQSQDGQRG